MSALREFAGDGARPVAVIDITIRAKPDGLMKQWWVTLTTFERRDERSDILPEWAQGAAGWMGVFAADEDDVRQVLSDDLAALELRLLEIDRTVLLNTIDAEELDEHLAENLQSLEPGKRSIWGTIHCYKGEGEA